MLAALGSLAVASHSPAFFWAGSQHLGLGRQVRHLNEATGEDLERAVAALLGQPGNRGGPLLQQPVGEGPKPEVQLVFLLDGLDTEAFRSAGGQMRYVQGLVDKSASSLTVPFTTRSAAHPTIFEKAPRLRAESAMAHLDAHPEIFNNKAADLLVIESEASDLATHDELIHRVCKQVSEATGGNYAALVTGSKQRFELTRRRLDASASGGVKLMITRDLLTALMVSFLLFIIFMSGFCCLVTVQTPRKFEDASKAI